MSVFPCRTHCLIVSSNVQIKYKESHYIYSEWLLFNANTAIYSTISTYIVLVHWNISPRWKYRPTRTHYPDSELTSLFVFLNAACLAEKQHISILISLVWPDRGSNPQYTALEASRLTITPRMWSTIYRRYPLNYLKICLMLNNTTNKYIKTPLYKYKSFSLHDI